WFGGQEKRALNTQLLRDIPDNLGPIPDMPVNAETALRCPAVLCAVQVLSSDLASLPIVTYRRTSDGKAKADDVWVYAVLHDAPNPFQYAKGFWKTFWGNVFTHGEGFAFINRTIGGQANLQLIHPCRVRVDIKDTGYQYVIDNKTRIKPADMVHVRFYS